MEWPKRNPEQRDRICVEEELRHFFTGSVGLNFQKATGRK